MKVLWSGQGELPQAAVEALNVPGGSGLSSVSGEMTHEMIRRRPVDELCLEWRDDSLWLFDGRTSQRPVRVDFLEDWRRLKIGKQDLLAKAVGVKGAGLSVTDATAGWGQDTLRLLKLGCEVTAIEHSPVLYSLLRDGLRRASGQDEKWRSEVAPRLHLIHGDAAEILPEMNPVRREVIFMDPMFPERKKAALAKGEMQLLQALLGKTADHDLERLWRAGRESAGRRLVFKSPRLTKPVTEKPKPTLQFEGRSIRYDVWL
jgi:16S rRNA (guanine1516-N2)-methyltransferase